MTLTFNCPKCGQICAFPDKHATRHARCTNCNQKFIIPSQSGATPKKVKTVYAEEGPISGFYHAALLESNRIFKAPSARTAVVFVAVLAISKFFARHMNFGLTFYAKAVDRFITIPIPIGYITALAAVGLLFWYYMECIYSTAFGDDPLPEIHPGGRAVLFAKIISSLYSFTIALIVIEAPFIIAIVVLSKFYLCPGWLKYTFLGMGLFFFPMAVFTVAIGKDLTMLLRPDYLVKPILKAPGPYLLVAALLIPAGLIQYKTFAFGYLMNQGLLSNLLHLLADIAAAFFTLFAVRPIGLFYRHYSCYLPW